MDTLSRIPGYGKLATLLLIFLAIAGPLTVSKGEETKGLESNAKNEESGGMTIISKDSLLAQNRIEPLSQASKIVITAYSSSPEETDETPFITAAGTAVRPGIAAANFLPIGTKIRLPDAFGEQVFVIEDRMHSRYSDRVDVWFDDKSTAQDFGKQLSRIEIL